jgi:hypothetical protein
VELFRIASNTTYTLGEGFSALLQDCVVLINSFYKSLNPEDNYGSVAV